MTTNLKEQELGTIVMVGLGRVGLPLALAFLEKGSTVVGVDVDTKKLEQLQRGEMPFMERGAEPILRRWIQKRFTVTFDLQEAVSQASTIVLTLGTPVDEHMNPIFEQIEAALVKMTPFLKPGQLIVLRSTVYPGTTEYLKRFIERRTKLVVGESLFLAYCPERISEGNSLEELASIPQIVGTLDQESSLRAQTLFRHLTSKIIPSDARSAELAKLFCNMYRYIGFAIANEFMMIADNYERNIYEIIELVNKDYARGGLKKPGFAGGPCLYKDGFFLINDIPYNELISIAWKINETVPAYLINKIKTLLPLDGRKVAILGLAFKRDIDDSRNSLSYKAKKIFVKEGAQVFLHDPYLKPVELSVVLQDADVVLLAVNHQSYKELSLQKIAQWVKPDCLLCDIWNILGTNRIVFRIADVVSSKPLMAALASRSESVV